MSVTNVSKPAGKHRSAWALVPLAVAQLIISLDIYIVFVALPDMGADLGFTQQTLQWVISAYAVAFGGFLLLGGRAADLLGRRRMFLLALGLYAASSLVGGLAGNPTTVIVARAVQGLGGALLFPATLTLVNTLFEEGPERNRALAIWGGAGASGLTLGSLLGGILTGAFGWQAVFFVNVPLAAAVAVVALLVVPADTPTHGTRRFDLPGALTVTAGIALLVYVLVEGPAIGWGSASVIVSAALAVVLLVCFAAIERRSADPLMPIRLFRNRNLLTGIAITFTFMATLGALPYFLTVEYQDVLRLSALQAGLAFLPQALAIAAGTQLGERLVARVASRTTLVIGFAGAAVGTAILAAGMSTGGGYATLVPGLVVMGVGQGIAWTAMWIAAASGVAAGEQGVASGMASTTQQTGYALGLAILVAIANAGIRGLHGAALHDALAGGTRTAVYIIAVASLVGALVALGLPRRTAGSTPDEPPVDTDSREEVRAGQH